MTGVLEGVRVIEIAGLGPGPFCAMLLGDLGAEVITVERPGSRVGRPDQVYNRGKRSIMLDLKSANSRQIVLHLVERADVLIEGMRPGVMERLGLGPEPCLERNPRLVYGRVTGWGQSGPLAQAAGHDSNYAALAGALWYAGAPGSPPFLPTTLTGDVAGGALYLAIGLLAALLRSRGGSEGQVVDAAIVDGTAHSMNLLLATLASVGADDRRGIYAMDAAHWAGRSYRCADGEWINISPLEPQFYALLLERLGLDDDIRFVNGQHDPELWSELSFELAQIFGSRPRSQWCALLEGTDACFAPILSPAEAHEHPHMIARKVYVVQDGVLQGCAAPRFSSTPSESPRPVPVRGADTAQILAELGYTEADLSALAASGCFGQIAPDGQMRAN